MKKVASYIVIAVLAIAFGNSLVHASEISGTISTDGNNNPTQTPNPTGENSGTNGTLAANVSGGININAPFDPDFLPGGRLSRETVAAAASTQTEASTTQGISDEEMARLALVNFGPRFGVPGAPDAGGGSGLSGGGRYENITVSSNETTPESTPTPSSIARLPNPGAGPVNDTNLIAAAITNASGLSMPQLVLIALLGLILLASMGYAISRTGNTRRTIV